jgi:hypothetical protein
VVDSVKRAFEDLDPPVCPKCQLDMKWTHSTLVARDTINHVFHCPSCYRAGSTTTKIEVIVVSPDKLFSPIIQRAA